MPVTPTYPGVYVEEIPSGVRTIVGVSTSVAAFIDFFSMGPMNEAVRIYNMGDFVREFGGLHPLSEASYGIQQFFLNGGAEAWVVRTASGNFAPAAVQIQDDAGGTTVLTITAANPGEWGNRLRVRIDSPRPQSNQRFNMTVSLVETRAGLPVVLESEEFRGLSMDSNDRMFVQSVVNDDRRGSKLVTVSAVAGGARPAQTGTVSGDLSAVDFVAMTAVSPQLQVTIGTDGEGTAALERRPNDLREARRMLESAIRAADPGVRAFSEATVSIVDNRLRILAGPTASSHTVAFRPTPGDPATLTMIGLTPGARLEGVLSDDASGAWPHAGGDLQVTIGGIAPMTLTLGPMDDLDAARAELEDQIQAADPSLEYAAARVASHVDAGEERLIVLAGVPDVPVVLGPEGTDTTVAELGLEPALSSTVEAFLSENLDPVPEVTAESEVYVTVGALGPFTAATAADAFTLDDIATELQAAIRAADPDDNAPFTGARVASYTTGAGENCLVFLAGTTGDSVWFKPAPADATTVGELRLDAASGALENVQLYALGADAAIPNTAHGAGTAGADGIPPDGAALIGDQNSKTGLYALEDVDLFNILCIPRSAIVSGGDHPLSAGDVTSVISQAQTYCERRRAFLILDTPDDVDEPDEIGQWLADNPGFSHKNSALYFPRVRIPDPENDFRLRSTGSSGTIAGLYARIDGARGVWKAPAGTEAVLRGLSELDYTVSDPENGSLNPLAVNCLRNLKIFGTVSWGARTREGSDQLASEWKYIPVRRLALFIEESLYRGTQWVVFEPNDEPLWAQIRLSVGSFMNRLFRQGAFQGSTPHEAYLVKCDKETTTQDDINRGIVNIVVGFSPLIPAEFVIIRIQQIAGQVQR